MGKMENHSSSNSNKCYPLDVEYCGSCGMPCDLCIYYENYNNCSEWLKIKHPDRYQKHLAECLEKLKLNTTSSNINVKLSEENLFVGVSEKFEANGKRSTMISGLSKFGVNVKSASECLAKIFCCKSYVKGEDIVVEGSRKKQLYEVLLEKWEIDPFDIEDLDNIKTQ